MRFAGDDWLFFPTIIPNVAIIRATTADERGNLSYEHEGGILGPLDQALARAQQRRPRHRAGQAARGGGHRCGRTTSSCPACWSTSSSSRPIRCRRRNTPYEPAISGEIFRPLSSFETPEFDVAKVIARRVAQELRDGDAVNIGFGISANVPRILIEEGRHGAVTWVIEQGAVGGVPLLDFQFGCASNAEAIVPSPHQFTYFQGGGFDMSLLSFLQIDRQGSVNVSKLGVRPHVTAGAGGFVDITARAKTIVFSGYFTAGAGARHRGRRAAHQQGRQGQEARRSGRADLLLRPARGRAGAGDRLCHRALRDAARARGRDRHRDRAGRRSRARRARAGRIPAARRRTICKTMDAALFHPEPFGLQLRPAQEAAR